MKKIIFLIIFLLLIPLNLFSNELEKSLTLSLTISQAKSETSGSGYGQTYSKEILNLGIFVYGNLIKDTEKFNWKNTLDIEYALSRYIDEFSANSNTDWFENEDQFVINSVYMRKFSKWINPYIAINLDTSMYDTDFLFEWKAFRPVQLRESGGIGFPFISGDNQELTVRIGLFYQHYINSPDNLDQNFGGKELIVECKNQINKRTLLTSKLGLFSSMAEIIDFDNSIYEKDIIELDWDATITTSLTKYLNLNLYFNLKNIDLTDNDANFEWEQRINLAFTYTLQ